MALTTLVLDPTADWVLLDGGTAGGAVVQTITFQAGSEPIEILGTIDTTQPPTTAIGRKVDAWTGLRGIPLYRLFLGAGVSHVWARGHRATKPSIVYYDTATNLAPGVDAGGGAGSLSELNGVDVATAPPENGQALIFDLLLGEWVAGIPDPKLFNDDDDAISGRFGFDDNGPYLEV